MFNKMLVITLGVTGLSSVLLFLYFRNRIGQVEEKVDTVFQLIQNYESNRQPQFTVHENQPQEYYVEEQQQQDYDEEHHQQQSNPNNDLIAVSDKNSDSESESDESESESDESESDSEDSDNEEDKQLVLDTEESKVEDVKVDNVEELDNLNLVKNVEHEEGKDVKDHEDDEDDDDDEEDDDDEDDDDESLESSKKITIDENSDLDKLKVSELKKLCKEKGLSGYKSLRKNDLINLLNE